MSWPVVKLGDVLKNVQPGFASGKDLEDGTLQVRMNNVKPDGSWDWNKKRIVPATDKQIEKYSLEVGDVLFNATNSAEQVGKSALYSTIVENTVCFSNHFLRLRTDNKRLLPQYLVRYLSYLWRIRVFENMVDAWVNQATVRREDFLNLEIPLPPLDEQKRIAAILDKADAIRQKRKQAITLADEFLRSVFLEMFGDPVTNPKGWEEPILSDIADVRSGVTKGKKLKEGTGITLPYMRVANVQDGYLDLSSIQTITVSEKDAEKCKLLRGDILLTEGGDPDKLGRGHVWNGEIDNCIHQNHIFSVRVKDEDYVRPAFLSAVIGSQRGKRYFLKVGKQTTGIATINKTVLSEFCPIVPPLELQDSYLKIASRIKRMQTRKHYHEVTLFPSLSQKAFSGQL
ncbi:restriction endonuclease subunit S [Vibrio cholerae]|uniref:restriction endonuclease subunit S n=1 Tax=Vibrio cholerae TaxID=666 RepID=UPI001158B154|nr:restriction endonuclease subunit S [Vibrio cholerae]TQP74051.1 restriction endonuclease subunit S [Vibrio cholerae]